MQRLSKIARAVPRNGSRALSQKVEILKNQGKEILHLTSAPVDSPGPHVIEAAIEAVSSGRRSSSRGFPEFREAIARKVYDENAINCDPEKDILVTNGSMNAIFVALAGCINPGDEVIMIAPCFYFPGAVQLLGGVCRFVHLDASNGFQINIDRIEQQITSKTRALIWNTPVNPSGYVATEEDTRALAALAAKYDFMVLADEAFEKWVFDGRRHISIGSLPEVRERVITIHSFSKTYSMARWRIGYLVAPGMDIDKIQKLFEHVLLECSSVSQLAATAALTGPQEWVQALSLKIHKQCKLTCEGLASIGNVSFPTPQGGPNVFVNISRIAASDEQFSDYILREYGLPMVPGTAFGCPGHLRFCFAGNENELRKAIERFKDAVETFPGNA